MEYATYPTWELRNMKKALSMLRALNTPKEEARLKEVTKELKTRKK